MTPTQRHADHNTSTPEDVIADSKRRIAQAAAVVLRDNAIDTPADSAAAATPHRPLRGNPVVAGLLLASTPNPRKMGALLVMLHMATVLAAAGAVQEFARLGLSEDDLDDGRGFEAHPA